MQYSIWDLTNKFEAGGLMVSWKPEGTLAWRSLRFDIYCLLNNFETYTFGPVTFDSLYDILLYAEDEG